MKRILVVHTGGGLGDVLLSTPVVEALHQGYPGVEVDFWVRRSTSVVLKRHPGLRKLHIIEGRAPGSPAEIMRWAKQLKVERYDAALVLWSVTGLAWTLFAAGIPRRVGQDSRLAYSFLYTHKVKVRSEHGDEQSHWTEVLLDYVRALGLEPGPPQVQFVLSPEGQEKAAQLLQQHPLVEGALLGFHTGKGMQLTVERWPIAAFASWAEALQRQGHRLVLTGGPDEVELVTAVETRLSHPVLNLAGKTDLDTLAAVAARCNTFVCPDSGPMHLAAAVGTPIVGIYALDEDFPARWAPFCPHHRIVRPQHRNCRPGCLKATCPDFRCYHQVTPEMVVEAVEEMLDRDRTSSP